MTWLVEEEQEILQTIRAMTGQMDDLKQRHSDCCKETQNKLNLIQDKLNQFETNLAQLTLDSVKIREGIWDLNVLVNELLPGAPVSFSVVFSGTTDSTLNDNATGSVTATPLDASGSPTILPDGVTVGLMSSDLTVMTVSQTGVCTNAVPPKLGAVTITASAKLADGTVITGTSKTINVVAGPPTSLDVNVT
jgi:hypothetical protein